MPDYNLDRIRNIIGEINTAYTRLEKIKKLKKEEFLASQETIDAAKYNLIVLMEGACDICNHIAAKAGGQAPASYADCFSVLEDLNILSAELAAKLKLMAKFRNLLVHRYRKVDNDRVYDIIIKDIAAVSEYVKTVDSYIRYGRQDKR